MKPRVLSALHFIEPSNMYLQILSYILHYSICITSRFHMAENNYGACLALQNNFRYFAEVLKDFLQSFLVVFAFPISSVFPSNVN